MLLVLYLRGFLGSLPGRKKIHLQCRRPQFDSWVGSFPWRRDRLSTLVFIRFPGGSDGKESACTSGGLGLIPWLGRSPEEGKATTPVCLPGESPRTEEPGGLQSRESGRLQTMQQQRVRLDRAARHSSTVPEETSPSPGFLLCFFPNEFYNFTLGYVIHFELIFVYSARYESRIFCFVLHMNIYSF